MKTFKLWVDVYERMEAEANRRGLKVSRLVNLALTEWLQVNEGKPNLTTHNAFVDETDEDI